MFDWLGESPATSVQWVDIVLSFIAFGIAVVALPTIFQRLWGRAKLEIEFDRHAMDSERVLLIHLKNPPVKSQWGKRMGVTRDSIKSLAATTRIFEAGSGRVVDPLRHMRIYPDDDLDGHSFSRISLPPTYSVGAGILIALWESEPRAARIPPDQVRPPLFLGTGYYRLEIIFLVDGEPEPYQKHFTVGKTADDLVWG